MLEKFDPVTPEVIKNRDNFDKLSEKEKREEISSLWEHALHENSDNFYKKSMVEKDQEKRELLLLVLDIVETVKAEGGSAFIVGGYARDEALSRFGYNVDPKDIDVEVFGIEFNKLLDILKKFGDPNAVGASFRVLKIGEIDVSIPRKDSKTGSGHKGFIIESDPHMTIEEAVSRRDFTINALILNPLTGEIIDKRGGLGDIQNKILRANDERFFGDDPLRALRAMQFAGRFGFDIDSETVEICRKLDLKELSKERVGEEWIKLLLKSPKPSIVLEAGRKIGVFEKLHPEFAKLDQIEQDKKWHPEGSVWNHTKMVVDASADLVRERELANEDALVIMLAALCHDLGKVGTTFEEEGKILSHGHPKAGTEPTLNFLKCINMPKRIIERVIPLVEEHMFPISNLEFSDSAVRRLSNRLHPATIQELVLISEADKRGRDLEWTGFPEGESLLQKANELTVSEKAPKPLVTGKHLLDLGLAPGPRFGEILGFLFEAQLEGKFFSPEEGLEYFKKNFK